MTIQYQHVRIIGKRPFSGDIVFNIPATDMTQDQFDELFGFGRDLIPQLSQSFDLRKDLGEDILLIALTAEFISRFGPPNFELIHVVYRLLDNEIERGSHFSDIIFEHD
jgi:hypothetical protein